MDVDPCIYTDKNVVVKEASLSVASTGVIYGRYIFIGRCARESKRFCPLPTIPSFVYLPHMYRSLSHIPSHSNNEYQAKAR